MRCIREKFPECNKQFDALNRHHGFSGETEVAYCLSKLYRLSGKKLFPIICCVLISLFAAGCAQTPQEVEIVPTDFFSPQTKTVIEPGDVMRVQFYFHPEMNQVQRVRPDGKMSFAFFQGLDVAGLTPEELQKKLVDLYTKEFVKPVITVSFEEKASRAVYVVGEVGEGGYKPIPTNATVGQLLTQCRLDLRRASLDSVILVRRHSEKEYRAYKIDADFTAGKERDIYLASGDIIYIPRNAITQVGDFVQQYIRDVIPPQMTLGLGFTYELHAEDTRVVAE